MNEGKFKTMRIRQMGSSRRGMTLIEVMVAITIFATSLLWAIQAIFGAVATNRALMASMTGNSVIRGQIEELYGVAMDNVEKFGDFAQAAIFYYGSEIATPNSGASGDVLAIGPSGSNVSRITLTSNGILTYRFVVPAPGESMRALSTAMHDVGTTLNAGQMVPYRRGIGEMVFYLNESLMPGDATDPSSSGSSPLWTPLGLNTSADNNRITPVSGPFTTGDLRNPDDKGFTRVFVDVTVTYFSDDTQQREIFTNTRRVLLNGSLSNLFLYY